MSTTELREFWFQDNSGEDPVKVITVDEGQAALQMLGMLGWFPWIPAEDEEEEVE